MNWRRVLSWEVDIRPIHYIEFTPLNPMMEYKCKDVEGLSIAQCKKLKVTNKLKEVTCPHCKELEKHQIIQEKLLGEHEKEAKRNRAEFYNFGAGVGDYGIYSKTSKGGLESEIDPVTLRVTHEWSN
jgi:hypothetical protein